MNAQLLQLLKCPVCLEYMNPPIRHCVNGHLVCNDCFSMVDRCPTCRGDLTHDRNLAMEQVANMVTYPCENVGCTGFTLAEKDVHLRDCQFHQLPCPYQEACAYNGNFSEVQSHLVTSHSIVPVSTDGRMFYRAKHFDVRNWWKIIFKWNDDMFRYS